MTQANIEPEDVVSFWREAGAEKWFRKSDEFDEAIRERFEKTWQAARDGGLKGWADTPEGRLALILVLDQFPRNMFRNDERAFSTDAQALRHARAALRNDEVDAMSEDVAVFALMPFMHSESILDQRDGALAMMRPGWAENFRFAIVHRDVIARFGRFPHRNAVLGRPTSPAERAFLEGGGFGG